MRTGMFTTLIIFFISCSENDLWDLKLLVIHRIWISKLPQRRWTFGILSYEDLSIDSNVYDYVFAGSDPATVTDIEIHEAASFTLLMPFEEVTLKMDESIDIQVAFQPMNPICPVPLKRLYSRTMQKNRRYQSHWLSGAAPNLLITPDPSNFVRIRKFHCNMPNEITLSNIWSGRFGHLQHWWTEDHFLSEALPAFPLTFVTGISHTLRRILAYLD